MPQSEASVLSNPVVVAGLVVLVLIEFGLMLWALIDWVKRPAEQIRGNRILWLILLAFVNIVGPVLYLTLGRLPKAADDVVSPLVGAAADDSLNVLYGEQEPKR